MTPIDVVLALLALVAKLAPGLLAAMSSTATDEEAIAAARAALPQHLDADDPDPERDRKRRERIRETHAETVARLTEREPSVAAGVSHDARLETTALVAVASQLTRQDVQALLAACPPATRGIFASELHPGESDSAEPEEDTSERSHDAPTTPPIPSAEDVYGGDG
jgi:hypothetical protein